jgi:hypothetical protein
MKFLTLGSISALSLLVGSAVLGAIAPAQAGETSTAKFTCGTSQGVPATVAMTTRGKSPVIRWSSNYFGSSGYSAQYRCNVVSAKFQQYYSAGMLNYLTTGVSNKQAVVCVAKVKGGPCAGVLFTLKPGSDPWTTLTRLMNVRTQAGPVLNESASSAPPEASIADGKYIDMNAFLNSAEVEPTISTPKTDTSSTSQSVPKKGLW